MKNGIKLASSLLLITITSPVARSQVAAPAIDASGIRPLRLALDQLQQQVMKPVDFEEAPSRYSADLGSRSVLTAKGQKPLLFPCPGSFSAIFNNTDRTDLYATAQALVSA